MRNGQKIYVIFKPLNIENNFQLQNKKNVQTTKEHKHSGCNIFVAAVMLSASFSLEVTQQRAALCSYTTTRLL